mgnify:CR=1 FL=1
MDSMPPSTCTTCPWRVGLRGYGHEIRVYPLNLCRAGGAEGLAQASGIFAADFAGAGAGRLELVHGEDGAAVAESYTGQYLKPMLAHPARKSA